MNTFRSFLTLLIIFLSPMFLLRAKSFEAEEKIVVKLSTESKLLPLYLPPFYLENPGLETTYVNQIEQIIRFDLNHNGMTFTIPHEAHPVVRFSDEDPLSKWKGLSVYYVLMIQVKDKKLGARLLSIHGHQENSIEGIPLTGNLSEDRRLIHRLADTIHKALFDSEGVASTKIIYTLKTDQGNKATAEIWEADYDGGNAKQITQEKTLIVTPTYIPPKPGYNAGSIMYVSYKTGQSKIYVASLKDGVGRRLSLLKGNQLMPTVSRKRDKVAFICDYTGNPDLFVQSFDPEKGILGKPQQIFATHLATQGTPTFSPEGNQVAFVSNKDGSPRIYVMEIPPAGASIKDLKATLISKHNRENTAPAWSPDGSKLAYCSMVGGVRQIWIYDFNTRQERQITQGGGHKENPTWAPNSLHLIFNSTGSGSSELYLINLNQPEAVKITSGKGEKRFPVWEPK